MNIEECFKYTLDEHEKTKKLIIERFNVIRTYLEDHQIDYSKTMLIPRDNMFGLYFGHSDNGLSVYFTFDDEFVTVLFSGFSEDCKIQYKNGYEDVPISAFFENKVNIPLWVKPYLAQLKL